MTPKNYLFFRIHVEIKQMIEKLKLNFEKNSSKMSEKLKNRQLQLSSDGGIFL